MNKLLWDVAISSLEMDATSCYKLAVEGGGVLQVRNSSKSVRGKSAKYVLRHGYSYSISNDVGCGFYKQLRFNWAFLKCQSSINLKSVLNRYHKNFALPLHKIKSYIFEVGQAQDCKTSNIWHNVFKNGPSKICGRQLL